MMNTIQRAVLAAGSRGFHGSRGLASSAFQTARRPSNRILSATGASSLLRSPCKTQYSLFQQSRHLASTRRLSQKAEVKQAEVASLADAKLVDVQLVVDRRMVETVWEDGDRQLYPYVWLRDNCQCEKCFHPVTRARQLLIMDLNVDTTPKDIQVSMLL